MDEKVTVGKDQARTDEHLLPETEPVRKETSRRNNSKTFLILALPFASPVNTLSIQS